MHSIVLNVNSKEFNERIVQGFIIIMEEEQTYGQLFFLGIIFCNQVFDRRGQLDFGRIVFFIQSIEF